MEWTGVVLLVVATISVIVVAALWFRHQRWMRRHDLNTETTRRSLQLEYDKFDAWRRHSEANMSPAARKVLGEQNSRNYGDESMQGVAPVVGLTSIRGGKNPSPEPDDESDESDDEAKAEDEL